MIPITTHDLGQHLGWYGVDTVDTPNIDALAGRGVRFENAYASTPAGGSPLTGRYRTRTD